VIETPKPGFAVFDAPPGGRLRDSARIPRGGPALAFVPSRAGAGAAAAPGAAWQLPLTLVPTVTVLKVLAFVAVLFRR
jgi:hypothetical protein